jgi:siroheme synthase-like protein
MMKQFAPISVNVKDRNILIVGGGKSALLKARGISRFTENITVIAPEIVEELKVISLNTIYEAYKEIHLDNFFMVYACTNDTILNEKIRQDCQQRNILCSICDNPDDSTFVSPAIYKNQDITISIGTNGNSPKRAISIRNQIQELIEKGILKIEDQ